ncbi:hypothetical protein NARC_10361 [Candidatus Nitrosocosmicus arcticus]|uniref:Uncharacterized protein n=1 Tax=Candidatus Nitrosocosmicus arcticus TaxID=2035267 RepID=A0A557SZE1_9ARCH|nr:hypothetical protein NARC_10361 [Candidatus Nitrosocosmicus arcticus]
MCNGQNVREARKIISESCVYKKHLIDYHIGSQTKNVLEMMMYYINAS